MSTENRLKRPRLERTRPIRSWSGVLGASGGVAPTEGDSATDGGRSPRIEDAISRSIELGYRVVDDYIQQGQRAAQRLSTGRLGAETVASEMQDLGARIARYASDFFGAWVELLDLAAEGSAARRHAAAPAGAAPAAAGPANPPPKATNPDRRTPSGVRLEVVSTRPTDIDLDLRLERVTGALRAHALRSADPRKPRLDPPTIRPDETGRTTPVLTVRVPDGHPAGSYEGLILDEATNRPVGSLRVTLGAPGARRSAKRRK